MQRAPITVGDVPCWAPARHLRRRAGLGAVPERPSSASRLWDTLIDAGRPHGLVPGGYRAIDSLRLEKGYRAWGSRHHQRDRSLLGRARLRRAQSTSDFLGKDALPPTDGGSQRLCCLVLDDPRSVALGNEPVSTAARGEVVGRVSSGGLGYSLGVSIAYAWLPDQPRRRPATAVAVEVFGERVAATVRADPLYDPAGARLRG